VKLSHNFKIDIITIQKKQEVVYFKTIFPIFLTQRQFGIFWIVNVLPLSCTYTSFLNHLRVKMFLAFAIFLHLLGAHLISRKKFIMLH